MRKRLLFSLLVVSFESVAVGQARVEVAFPNLTFMNPVDLQNAGDGTNRLFVVEQQGRIIVFQNSPLVSTSKVFLDITDRVLSGGEMGLLGLAFHPQYEQSGYLYVNYILPNPPRSVISRFRVTAGDPDKADSLSETILVTVPQPYENHNGGQLSFGPDGYLYVGLGDGGSGGDPENNGQNLSTLLGKILRIDVDSPSGQNNYGIPGDNPFAGNTSGYREEIWAYGLRNPWRFSFDSVTGQLWCGDVGQNAREEIDIIERGKNYGWRIMEGTLCHNPSTGCNTSGLTFPIWDYPRSIGGSITGGFIYRGGRVTALFGQYVFGDFVSGFIAAVAYDGTNPPVVTPLDTLPPYRLTSFGVDEANDLYLCSFDGKIYKLESSPPTGVGQSSEPLLPTPLLHIFPNPLNPSTTLEFCVPEASTVVTLEVFDQIGQKVASLVDGAKDARWHRVAWDASRLAAGTYYARLFLKGKNTIHTRKMFLLR